MIHFHNGAGRTIHPLTYLLVGSLVVIVIVYIMSFGNSNQKTQTAFAISNLNTKLTRMEATDSAILKILLKTQEIVERLPTKIPININEVTGVSSTFGMRKNPITGKTEFHKATDFRAKIGTPVVAAGSGIVIKVAWVTGYGNTVEIDHQVGGNETLYGHLSIFKVMPGQYVHKGDTIALSGNTGNSTGPHLHFALTSDDKPVDSNLYL
jgi:murein DD-endopeptidase MepM/ murein hydrolase activator NlpD